MLDIGCQRDRIPPQGKIRKKDHVLITIITKPCYPIIVNLRSTIILLIARPNPTPVSIIRTDLIVITIPILPCYISIVNLRRFIPVEIVRQLESRT